MTQARETQISVADTPYYHCMARCVRRAYLCGEDKFSGKDFSYRRGWIKDKLMILSGIFAIDVCAYAVMNNHYHVVLRIDTKEAEGWSDQQVIERWLSLFNGTSLVQRYLAGEKMGKANRLKIKEIAELWRSRLMDISWFMRCLNEHIARMANKEDNCKGRFWEGRFKSQALLDDAALLTCMAYVDLNPIRAKVSNDLMTSDFTSIQERLFEIVKGRRKNKNKTNQNAKFATTTTSTALLGFAAFERNTKRKNRKAVLPFNCQDYLDLVDFSGRCIREDKRGAIEGKIPPILQTLGINPNEWLPTVTQLQDRFELVIGSPERLKHYSQEKKQAWCWGYRSSLRLYQQVQAA